MLDVGAGGRRLNRIRPRTPVTLPLRTSVEATPRVDGLSTEGAFGVILFPVRPCIPSPSGRRRRIAEGLGGGADAVTAAEEPGGPWNRLASVGGAGRRYENALAVGVSETEGTTRVVSEGDDVDSGRIVLSTLPFDAIRGKCLPNFRPSVLPSEPYLAALLAIEPEPETKPVDRDVEVDEEDAWSIPAVDRSFGERPCGGTTVDLNADSGCDFDTPLEARDR